MNDQNSNDNLQSQHTMSNDQQQTGPVQTDIVISKRSAVRQKMAIALMAVGGALVAGLIWFAFTVKDGTR